jgi:hypothetical protein
MIRTDELKLLHLDILEDGRFAFTLPSSPEDWTYRRTAALHMLQERSTIPDVLLNLVLLELKELTPVKLKCRKTSESAWNFEVEVVETKIDFPSESLWSVGV